MMAAYVVDAGNVVVKAKRTGARTGIVDNASSAYKYLSDASCTPSRDLATRAVP